MLAQFRALEHHPGEILRSDCTARPDVLLNANSQVVFGRNSTTQIADPTVCRKLATFELDAAGVLRLERLKSTIWVNGIAVEPIETCTTKLELKHGDTIALLPSSETRYRYQVHLLVPAAAAADNANNNNNAENAENVATTAEAAAPSPARKRSAAEAAAAAAAAPAPAVASSTIPSAVAEECVCQICLELQVQPTILVPCGHSFCASCISGTTSCPTCRQAIASQVLNRSLQHVISGLVERDVGLVANRCGSGGGEQGAFAADDVALYQQRMGITSSAAAAAATTTPVAAAGNKRQRHHAPPSRGFSVQDAICID